MAKFEENIRRGLDRIRRRSVPAVPWQDGANLPWDDPDFSERMLLEHLDQSHDAASRRLSRIHEQVKRLVEIMALPVGAEVLDLTCGPGLFATTFARKGYRVTGLDFAPAAIAYAREMAQGEGLECTFRLEDIRVAQLGESWTDGALVMYGQLPAFKPQETTGILERAARALRPGGRFVAEVKDDTTVPRESFTGWWMEEGGLWGDLVCLVLKESFFDPAQQASIDRYFVLNVESGEVQEYAVCEHTYTLVQWQEMFEAAGLKWIEPVLDWEQDGDLRWWLLVGER